NPPNSPSDPTPNTPPPVVPPPVMAQHVVLPLPLPGSKNAPEFTGRGVHEFVESIGLLGASAGYTDARLPPLLKRYSSSSVRRTLADETVFDGPDWVAAKARLVLLYGSMDDNRPSSVSKLRKFVEKYHDERSIRSRRQLDEYYHKFKARSGTLVADGALTDAERNYLFYRGLPRRFSKKIRPTLTAMLTAVNQTLTRNSPPSIETTMTAGRAQFNPDDIDRGSDSELSDDDDRRRGDVDSDDDSDDDRKRKSRGRTRTNKSPTPKAETPAPATAKEEPAEDPMLKLVLGLKEKFDELSIKMSAPPVPAQYVPPMSPRSCYMCGKVEGVDLDHRLNIKLCPQTQDLLEKGLIKFCPKTSQLIRANNAELPRSRGPGTGGIANVIRNEEVLRTRSRDAPPHQHLANSCNIGLYCDGRPVIQDSAYAAAADTVYVFPTTRSQTKAAGEVDKQVRFEEEDQPAASTSKSPAWKAIYKSPNIQQPADDAGKFTRVRTSEKTSTAPHPANTEDGWRAQEKQRTTDRRARIEEIPDEPVFSERTKGKSSPYRFTSTIQEQVSLDGVEKQLLGTKIALTLREILGMSPELQKHMQSLVKTRREFANRAGEWDLGMSEADPEVVALRTDEPGAAIVAFGETEDLRAILERYAHAVALGSRKHFAMQSGLVQGNFGSEKVTFLIDSGSELNVIARRVWEQTDVPVDSDGSRWSLRGISGDPVSLLGCCRDAPVQLGGKNFDHHFFVSTREHGPYDGILGQPWLSWFSSDIVYNRGGPTYLRAYPAGDKTGPFASVEICKSNAPRNADKLVLTGDA
ncbi:hypothetical protein PHLGIDRAFT_39869, partial [Phlebiopsis gigantea 11061_1 CR5-6]